MYNFVDNEKNNINDKHFWHFVEGKSIRNCLENLLKTLAKHWRNYYITYITYMQYLAAERSKDQTLAVGSLFQNMFNLFHFHTRALPSSYESARFIYLKTYEYARTMKESSWTASSLAPKSH